MRSSRPVEQADILVSELLGEFTDIYRTIHQQIVTSHQSSPPHLILGSWGDNELSPECLDGAQVFLKTGGISIPSSYTSFVGKI